MKNKDDARILIVDDQIHALQGVSRIMRGAGYETFEASNGADCLKMAMEQKPDLILLDVILPDIDGLEVCKRIKSNPETKDIYVVLLSSVKTESESQADGLEQGADGYIAKPIANKELLARVKSILRLKYVEDQLRDMVAKYKTSTHDLEVHQTKLKLQNEEIKRTHVEMEESRDKFQELYDFTPVGYFTLNHKGIIKEGNLTGAKLLGTPRSKLIGRGFGHFLAPESEDQWLQCVLSVINQKENQNCELSLKREDGSTFFVHLELSSMAVSIGQQGDAKDGHMIRMTATDISERKRLDDALEQTNAFLNTLLNAIPVPIFYKDTDGRYTGFNKLYEEFFGKTHQELVGKSVFDIAPRDLAEIYHAKDLELFHNPGTQVYNSKVKDAFGAVHDVVFHKSTFSDSQGHILGLIGAILDITERKRLEDALLDSEERQRSLVEHLPQRIFIKDRNSIYMSCNGNYASDLGITPEQIVGKNDFAFYTPELAQAYRADDQACMATGMAKDLEETYQLAGQERWIHTIKVPFHDNQGRVIGVLGIFEDITERRWIQEALRTSEERFRGMFSSHNAIMLLIEPLTGRIIDANKAAERFYGYTMSQLRSMFIQDINMMPPDEVERKRDLALQEHGNYFIFPHRLADGEVRTVEVHSSPIERNGELMLFSIIHDITDRILAESRLAEISELNQQIIANSPVGIGIYKADGQCIVTNDMAGEIL
jgi:PAS domain S-box-containing protein